jgi:YegS/Rv2252/BmrU family lipid kinase
MRATDTEFRITETASPDEAVEASREEALQSDVVVSVGGDGSLHYVATGLIDARLTGSNAALAALPVGTGNDFARMTGMPADLESALGALLHARPIVADHGWLIWDQEGVAIRRPFINCAGIGLDAKSAYLASRMKRFVGNASYLLAPVFTVPGWDAPESSIVIEGGNDHSRELWEGSLTLASVTNGVWIGGGIPVSPGARIDDRLLNLCLIPKVSTLRAYGLLAKAARGTHVGERGVLTQTVERVKVETSMPVPVYADGEPASSATQRATFEIAGGELPILVHKDYVSPEKET